MRATKASMKKMQGERNIVAFSPLTFEVSSANPGDYFYMADEDCLIDSDGEEMILARRIPERYEPID